jgi:hypothetical protein
MIMKKIAFLLFLTISLNACGQTDQTFEKIIIAKKGVQYGDGTIQLTASTVGQTIDWNTLAGKPEFSTVATSGSYKDLKDLPVQISLSEAIEQLGYLPIPEKTTEEINSMVLETGRSGIVKDKTLNVYKLWDKTGWLKIIITNQ